MLAGLMTLTLRFGIVSSAGGAAAMLAALAATTGAAHPRLDALHLLGFAGAGLLLFCLSSEDQAGVWFTPAMGWAGAIFLGLAAARAPVLGPQGGLIAATGSIAPLFAIFGLFVAGHGLAEPWMASIALAGIAVLLATILAVSARAAGSLHALSMPGWILGAGAFIAASASLLLTWPLAQDGAAFGALAFGLVLSHRRATDNLLLCGAALWALAALASSIAALIAFNTTIDLWPLAMRIFCMAAPTLLLATAALRLRRDTPATRIVLEIAAGACGLLALSALVRAVFTGGAPAAYPIGLSELGGHVLLWAALSLALLRYFRGGAREARTTAAGALACGAGAATFIALALWFFGAWTPTATSATGLAAFGQHAPAGFALMACAAWLHWDHWRRRDNPLRALSAFAFACILTAAWISLEYTWFRPPLEDGADLTIIGMTLLLFAVALGLVGFYAVQQTRRSARSHFHKNLKRNRRSHQRG
jgi:hypothetical protein